MLSVLFSEPKIPQLLRTRRNLYERADFQCSSASRKFLNNRQARAATSARRLSVLFSEPKIPQSRCAAVPLDQPISFSALQRAENSSILLTLDCACTTKQLSVLFSEPKIPQSDRAGDGLVKRDGFQCSSASRKFLNQ